MPKFAFTVATTNHVSRGVKAFILLAIICLSITGNSLIVAVVSRDTQYLTPTNIIVLSQLINDTIMTLTVMTLEAVSTSKGVLKVSHHGCIIHTYFVKLTIMLAVLRLTVLSVDRYLIIVKGSSKSWQKFTRRKVFVLLSLLWFEAIVVAFRREYFVSDTNPCLLETSLPCIQAYYFSVTAYNTNISKVRLILHGTVPFIVIIYCLYRILQTVCFNRQKIRPSVSRDCKDTTVEIQSDSAYIIILILSMFTI